MEALALALMVLVAMFILVLIVALISLIFLTFLFRKMGIAGWKAWIPVYNGWILLELGKLPGWIALFALAPLLGDTLTPGNEAILATLVGSLLSIALWVCMIIACYRIGIRMGKPGAFVLLAIFLMPVWIGILAFGKATWPKAAPAPATPATPPTFPPQHPPIA